MAEANPTKIVYLFGAGATHAELQNIDPDLAEKSGLLVSHLSKRVIEKATQDRDYLKDVKTVSGTSGSLNIELLISLIESSKIPGWEYKTQRLRSLDFARDDSGWGGLKLRGQNAHSNFAKGAKLEWGTRLVVVGLGLSIERNYRNDVIVRERWEI